MRSKAKGGGKKKRRTRKNDGLKGMDKVPQKK